ncbi:hypothetical protein [Kitasatospora sp. NPDC002040]|uniref:hypothetical protein n=1 Tax=Kitasatospora sp. NPDC002040 TaxID=3154661 RepID=UPI0033300023
MFTPQERDRVREQLLRAAEADPAITAAAITGSHAVGAADRWSDIDLAFAVDGGLDAALERWTELVHRDFSALHHWDLRSGAAVYRVFLLPGRLEVDLAFVPAAEFGPHGPSWRTVFGEAGRTAPAVPPTPDHLTGLAWHHALHARVCIERQRWWQAHYWIGAVRDQVIALACLRLGHPADYAKGAHLLPDEVTAPLAATLVRSLAEPELRRALTAVSSALAAELQLTDPALAARLQPVLEPHGPDPRSDG